MKAIIFDCFGVLVGKGFWVVYREAGGDLDKDGAFIDDILLQANTNTITRDEFTAEVAARLGLSVEEWTKIYQQEEKPNVPLLEYIRDELRPAHKIGVISNANRGTFKDVVPSEWHDIFDDVIISGEVGIVKPDPKIYELSARNLGVSPVEALFTDDRGQYLGGAQAVGMRTILYKNFDQFVKELRPHL